jgi:GT2 family glycosyltransferase
VVPTHEGAVDWLPECLAGLREQRDVVPEIIVVLDGPAPIAAETARSIVPAARQLHLRENRGFAVAATAGLRAARGGLVALLNDDAVPDPGWLAALLEAADRTPDAGSFASRVVQTAAPRLIDSAGHGLTRWGEPFAIGHGLPDGPPFAEERWVFGAPACASAYRAELIRDCGGFDAAMEAYLEDVDLSLRAQAFGFPCLYVPSARVVHRGSATYGWGSGSGRAERLHARNRLRLFARSMPRSVLRAGAPALAVSVAVDLAFRVARGDHPVPVLRGTIEGVQGLKAAAAGRPAALGARRVDDAWIGDILRDSEARLLELADGPSSGSRRARVALARALMAWVDRRERAQARPRW